MAFGLRVIINPLVTSHMYILNFGPKFYVWPIYAFISQELELVFSNCIYTSKYIVTDYR